ncbi:hypothetical protein TNCV_482161 [Trichonephila clavipes]|uniref:Uncharacterized protein n=1 Tax=Trichonephila clavipes TaxID=2585209 RepID=A0A8X6S6V6_TRICX|nr:hypothetical protein TNCV_482161 [Trichonephila clavipes]
MSTSHYFQRCITLKTRLETIWQTTPTQHAFCAKTSRATVTTSPFHTVACVPQVGHPCSCTTQPNRKLLAADGEVGDFPGIFQSPILLGPSLAAAL